MVQGQLGLLVNMLPHLELGILGHNLSRHLLQQVMVGMAETDAAPAVPNVARGSQSNMDTRSDR